MDSSTNISFSFEYAVSVIVVIIVCNILVKTSPKMNTAIVVVAGLLIGYIVLYIMNNFFPYLNQLSTSVYQYYVYQITNNYTSMGYMHIWPPILAVLIIFIILLYSGQLS
jgi:ABC-type Fe3+-siderophore transport system permease subunit